MGPSGIHVPYVAHPIKADAIVHKVPCALPPWERLWWTTSAFMAGRGPLSSDFLRLQVLKQVGCEK